MGQGNIEARVGKDAEAREAKEWEGMMLKLLGALLLAKWCLPVVVIVCLCVAVWAWSRRHG